MICGGGHRTLRPLAAALHLIPRRHHFPARELPQSEQDHGQRTGLQNGPQHPAEKPAEVIRRPIARTHPHIDRKRLAPIPLGDGSSRMGWVGRRNGRRARRGLARCVRRLISTTQKPEAGHDRSEGNEHGFRAKGRCQTTWRRRCWRSGKTRSSYFIKPQSRNRVRS